MDQAVISLVDKESMRLRLNAVFEKIRSYFKANLSNVIAAANAKAEEVAKKALEADVEVVIAQIEFGADGKIAKKIYEKLISIKPNASYFLLSTDEESDK